MMPKGFLVIIALVIVATVLTTVIDLYRKYLADKYEYSIYDLMNPVFYLRNPIFIPFFIIAIMGTFVYFLIFSEASNFSGGKATALMSLLLFLIVGTVSVIVRIWSFKLVGEAVNYNVWSYIMLFTVLQVLSIVCLLKLFYVEKFFEGAVKN